MLSRVRERATAEKFFKNVGAPPTQPPRPPDQRAVTADPAGARAVIRIPNETHSTLARTFSPREIRPFVAEAVRLPPKRIPRPKTKGPTEFLERTCAHAHPRRAAGQTARGSRRLITTLFEPGKIGSSPAALPQQCPKFPSPASAAAPTKVQLKAGTTFILPKF
jgi:hypothetical protein